MHFSTLANTLWRIKYFYTEHLTLAFVGGAEIQKSCEKIQKRSFLNEKWKLKGEFLIRYIAHDLRKIAK